MRRKGTASLLGAGTQFDNNGDDFSWLDAWSVEPKGSTQSSYYQTPLKLKSDGLLLAKTGSASGLVYFVRGGFKWQQQGD